MLADSVLHSFLRVVIYALDGILGTRPSDGRLLESDGGVDGAVGVA